jgi:hypothetical protein
LVHSIRHGDIARLVLEVTEKHRQEMKRNNEDECISTHKDAKVISSELRLAWGRARAAVLAATNGRIDIGAMRESEYGRSVPFGLGQDPHMDQVRNVPAIIVNLGTSTSTAIARYTYQQYPQNLGALSQVPDDWSKIVWDSIAWQCGDMLVMFQNCVHMAPPNHSADYRHIAFLGGSDESGESYSDSVVITNEVFQSLHRSYHACCA